MLCGDSFIRLESIEPECVEQREGVQVLDKVPVIDTQRLLRGSLAVQELFRRGLHDIGFVVLVNHRISSDLIQFAYSAAKRLFVHSDEVLSSYVAGDAGQTGFTPFGVERAKGSEQPDLKRFWHVRGENHDHANLWPKEEPSFRVAMLQLYSALYPLASALSVPVGRCVGYSDGAIDEMLCSYQTLLRAAHYPPVRDSATRAIRAGSHEDINLYTLLVAATRSGLEVKTRAGEWVSVNEGVGSIVFNVGDMLQMLTGGELISTSHRVVNPFDEESNVDRLSLPFFVHPKPGVVLNRETGYTAGEYLEQRLFEIGLSTK